MALEQILTDGTETGSSAALKINTGFAQTDTNTINIATIDSKVDTNTTNISTNTNNIATNTNNISTNAADIATLKAEVPFTPYYNHIAVQNVIVAGDTYERINQLDATGLEDGTYSITLSMIFNINTTTNSAYFRFSHDGGNNWIEVRQESKNVTDNIPLTYTFTDTVQGGTGTKSIYVDARKEVASDTLTIEAQEIMLERKL